MPNNFRIYWPVHAVGIAPHNTNNFVAVHGVQSVNITTTFNLEQVFELGQLSIYENIENLPDVEMTIEKVLDGYPLIYHLGARGAANRTLAGSQNQRSHIALSIFGDTQNSSSGTPIQQLELSGMYISSLTYTLPTEGNCTESVTFVGNNKTWRSASYTFTGGFLNTDEPLAINNGSGGVQRREDVIFDSIDLTGSNTLLPSGTNGVQGISSSGTNDKDADGQFGAHVSQITISTDLGREAINELGRKGPYYRYATFPVEVTCEIETISTKGDLVGATEAGYISDTVNLNPQKILVVMRDGTTFDLGTKNKLANVTYSGGDTGGANVTTTYSFSTFNDLTITHTQDPG